MSLADLLRGNLIFASNELRYALKDDKLRKDLIDALGKSDADARVKPHLWVTGTELHRCVLKGSLHSVDRGFDVSVIESATASHRSALHPITNKVLSS